MYGRVWMCAVCGVRFPCLAASDAAIRVMKQRRLAELPVHVVGATSDTGGRLVQLTL